MREPRAAVVPEPLAAVVPEPLALVVPEPPPAVVALGDRAEVTPTPKRGGFAPELLPFGPAARPRALATGI